MNDKSSYLYLLLTIIFTVYGQLVIKWRIQKYGMLPVELRDKIVFLLKLFLDPYILSGFIAAFLASLSWMATMTKLEISFAYPFMSLNFVLVLLFSVIVLNEVITIGKILGVLFIVLGLIIMVRF